MKYAFFGTPKFAAIVLEKLITAKMPPALLVCNPDRPVGRKKIITAPPTKQVIRNEKLEDRVEIVQPENPKSLISQLSSLKLDFAVVCAYAKILPLELLKVSRLGMVGVHPSLLPKYRGTTPIQSAILNGEAETGTTLFLLDEKVDHGAILANAKIQISNSKTYTELETELAELSGNLLVETLPKFVDGKIDLITQDENAATFTKKFKTDEGFIPDEMLRGAQDDAELRISLERKIRALNPEPGVYVIKNGKRIKILNLETIQYEGGKPRKVKGALNFLGSL